MDVLWSSHPLQLLKWAIFLYTLLIFYITPRLLSWFCGLALRGTITKYMSSCVFWYAKVNGKSIQWKTFYWVMNKFCIWFVVILCWIREIEFSCNKNPRGVLGSQMWFLCYCLFIQLIHMVQKFILSRIFKMYTQKCQVMW